MAKKQNTTEGTNESIEVKETVAEKMFTVSKDFLGTTRNILGGKPFISVAGIMPLMQKNIMSESEVNSIINVLGQFPYDEVAQLFSLIKDNIKPVEETPKK